MKKIIALLLALVMIVGLVACGGAAETPETELKIEEGPGAADIVIPEAPATEAPAEEEPAVDENPYAHLAGQTVKWWTYPYGEDEARWPQIIEIFTEKTGINVELTIIPWGAEGAAKLSAGFLGGVGPDVLYMTAETAYDMISGGHLADLTTVLKPETLENQIYAASTATNGVQYMLPMGVGVSARAYIFNNNYLKEAGIEKVPETREELIAAAIAIKEANLCEYPILMPTQEAEAAFSTVVSNLWSNGADFMTNGVPSFDTPEAKETMQYLYDLMFTHEVLSPDVNSMNVDMCVQLFAQGKAGIVCSAVGSGDLSKYYEFMEPEDFTIVPGMKVGDHPVKTFSPIDMLAVNANSEVPEAAAAWMEFLVSDEGRDAWATAFERKDLPCNYTQLDTAVVEYPHPDIETIAANLADVGRALPIGKGTQTMLDAIMAETQLMFAGEQTVDETCAAIQAACIAAQEN